MRFNQRIMNEKNMNEQKEESPCEGCAENNNLEWDERTCPRKKWGLCKKEEGEIYGDGTKHH